MAYPGPPQGLTPAVDSRAEYGWSVAAGMLATVEAKGTTTGDELLNTLGPQLNTQRLGIPSWSQVCQQDVGLEPDGQPFLLGGMVG